MTNEEKAKEYCPDDAYPFGPDIINKEVRKAFIAGYETAEKDLALTWKDMRTIIHVLADSDWYDFEISNKLWSQEFYEEVLKRFKETNDGNSTIHP